MGRLPRAGVIALVLCAFCATAIIGQAKTPGPGGPPMDGGGGGGARVRTGGLDCPYGLGELEYDDDPLDAFLCPPSQADMWPSDADYVATQGYSQALAPQLSDSPYGCPSAALSGSVQAPVVAPDPRGPALPSFVPSRTFVGPIPGMVFKLGSWGCGYYPDETRADTPAGPVTLRLDELVEHSQPMPSPSPTTAQADGAEAIRGGDCRPRGRRARGRRADGDGVAFVVPLETAAGDASHKAAGLFAVDSVNGNSWAGALGYLQHSAADVAAFQESKRMAHQTQTAEREAVRYGWVASMQPAARLDSGLASGGVGVAVRKHIGMSRAMGANEDVGLSYRTQLRWVSCAVRGGFHLGSVWLFPTEGLTQRNRRVLEEVALALRGVTGPWVLAGDWNLPPELLVQSGWLEQVRGSVVAPAVPTCNAAVDDYFVVSTSIRHAVAGVSAIHDAGLHPHSPVRLYIMGNVRQARSRCLIAPRRFEGTPPPGCPTLAACSASATAAALRASSAAKPSPPPDDDGVDYCTWVTAVEDDCAEMHGVGNDVHGAAYRGRASGPRFAWKPMAGAMAQPVPHTSSASRRWRSIAKWAGHIRDHATKVIDGHTPCETVVATALRAKRRLTHMANTTIADVDERQDEDRARTQRALGAAAAATLAVEDDPCALQTIADVARASARRLEAELAHSRKEQWLQWIGGGACQGLGRQHRFSKPRGGWVPSKVAEPPCPADHQSDGGPSQDSTAHDDVTTRESTFCSADGERAEVPPECWSSLYVQGTASAAPLDRQQVVDAQAKWWSDFWGVGLDLCKPSWENLAGVPPLPRPTVSQMRAALRSFPSGTALAWDGLNPRLMSRLSEARLEELISLMMEAEATGCWPEGIGDVTVVLLPRPDGGFRPIGLFPFMVRAWFRVRRPLVLKWEAETEAARDYLFAGKQKGAHVAAWQHAFRAEHAADSGATFAALLLDMEKCFEVVPHDVLAREAEQLGYPLQLLRLSLASYRLPRVLSADGAFSAEVIAERGIAAGSGLATAELRVLLIRLLDRVRAIYPSIKLSAYVDDISADATSTSPNVVATVSGAGRMLCQGLLDLGLRLSTSGKCIVIATAPTVARQVAHRLADFGVKAADRAKNLGTGIGGGRRRNATVQKKRWGALRARLGRFASLLRQGLSVARLFRTGVTASFTYGDDVLGVAPSTLEARRRTVASAIAQTAAGRSVDATLVFADEGARQRLDPAYEAHRGPLVRWAEAAWCRWQRPGAMAAAVHKATAKLARANAVWNQVTGPASAVVATAARIGWQVQGTTFVTDRGKALDLLVDPPCVVRREVDEAVQRWRRNRAGQILPHGRGPCHAAAADGAGLDVDVMEDVMDVSTQAIRKLLTPATKLLEWTHAHRRSLRSALLNTQWPQQRLFEAGLHDDPACQLCASAAIPRYDAPPDVMSPEAPWGTLVHRITSCAVNEAFIQSDFADSAANSVAVAAMARTALGHPRPGDEEMIERDSSDSWRHVRRGFHADRHPDGSAQHPRLPPTDQTRHAGERHWAQVGILARVHDLLGGVSQQLWRDAWGAAWRSCNSATAWTRADFPAVRIPSRPGGIDGSFHWDLPPHSDGIPNGVTVYTDASGYDGQLPLIAVYGWAFVAVDPQGEVVAEASGIVPEWVSSMSEAEAWALVKALQCSPPGAAYVTDCQAVLKQVDSGLARATSHCKPMARVMKMVHGLLDDDVGAHPVVWMPSHRSAAEVGRTCKSDGSELTLIDHTANNRADWLAKKRAKAARADPATRAAIAACRVLTLRVASHIGRATWSANANAENRGKDAATVSSPTRAAARLGLASVRRRGCVRGTADDERSFTVGGHLLVKDGSGGWRCAICWASSGRRARIAGQRCQGDVAAKWAERAQAMAAADAIDSVGHQLRITGPLTWCTRCGAYAEHHAVGLAAPCRGAPPRGGEFGRHTKLARLRRGCHPKSGMPLAAKAWASVADMIETARRDGLAAFRQHAGYGTYGNDSLDDDHARSRPRDDDPACAHAALGRRCALHDHGRVHFPGVPPAALHSGGAALDPGDPGDGRPVAKRQRTDARHGAPVVSAQLARPPTDAARRLAELRDRVRARAALQGPSSSSPTPSCCPQTATPAALGTTTPCSSPAASPSWPARQQLDVCTVLSSASSQQRIGERAILDTVMMLPPLADAEAGAAPSVDLGRHACDVNRQLPVVPDPAGAYTRRDKAQVLPLAFVDPPPQKKPRTGLVSASAVTGTDDPQHDEGGVEGTVRVGIVGLACDASASGSVLAEGGDPRAARATRQQDHVRPASNSPPRKVRRRCSVKRRDLLR